MIGDLWAPEERGQAIAVYSLAPLLGPVIGPICGAWIAERSVWRWVVSNSFDAGVIPSKFHVIVLVYIYCGRFHSVPWSFLLARE